LNLLEQCSRSLNVSALRVTNIFGTVGEAWTFIGDRRKTVGVKD